MSLRRMSLSTLVPVVPKPRAFFQMYRDIVVQTGDTRMCNTYPGRNATACAASVSGKTIILYSKDDCPLCDGLKDKISGILDRAQFTDSGLKGYSIEIRDIMTNPSWEEKFSMEIPVMAVEQSDGKEACFFHSYTQLHVLIRIMSISVVYRCR